MRVFLAILAAGCGPLSDFDRDGFPSLAHGGTDCDDGNAAVHPSAPEICGDELDNDCDGVVDDHGEGSVDIYEDADLDGWGQGSSLRLACPSQVASGESTRIGDCDDQDSRIHPDAPDTLCDGVDDDCDGLVDDGFGVVRMGDEPFDTLEQAIMAGLSADAPLMIDVCDSTRAHAIPTAELTDEHLTIRSARPEAPATLTTTAAGAVLTLLGNATLELEGITVETYAGPLSVSSSGESEVVLHAVQWRSGPEAIAEIGAAERSTVTVTETTVDLGSGSFVRLRDQARAHVEATALVVPQTAIHVSNSSVLTMSDCTASGNGILIDGMGTVTVELDTVELTGADRPLLVRGPGAGAVPARVSAAASRFADHRAGAWFSGGVQLDLDDVLITGTREERALLVRETVTGLSTVNLTSVEIADNLAGGARFQGPITVLAQGVHIYGNSTAGEGGGLVLHDAAFVGSVGTTVSRNQASCGGGVAMSGASQLQGARVEDNASTSDGGGVCLLQDPDRATSPEAMVHGVELIGNTAANRGGGIYKAGALILRLRSSSIFANHGLLGGGAYADVADHGYVESIDNHWGAGVDDNTPTDIRLSNGEGHSSWTDQYDWACNEALGCFTISVP